MKDIFIRSLKSSFDILPESLKSLLRKQNRVKEWYGEKLRKSSIAYEVPTLKKTRMRHKVNVAVQEQKLCSAKSQDEGKQLNVVIIGSENIPATFDSISCISPLVNTIWVSGEGREQQDLPFMYGVQTRYYKRGEELPQLGKTLVLSAGTMLYERLALQIVSLSGNSDICYFDNIVTDEKGKITDYHYLPDWNPDLLFSSAYIDNAVLLNTPKSQACLNQFVTLGIAGAFAKLYFATENLTVAHLPFTLTVRNSIGSADMDGVAQVLAERDVATVAMPSLLKVKWQLANPPLVSLVIPTFNGKELVKTCVGSILEKTSYKNYEILLVDNNSDDPESLTYFDELELHPKIRLLRYPHPFNYSAINNFAVKHAKGEVIGLINNDIEVITPQWLEYMVGHAMREDIGCVGAKLLYPDDRIQHAGVVLGYGGGAGHAHKYFPRYHPGYMNRLIATQNYSAVTAACLLVKKSIFEKVGGLDEVNLEVAFNDVDFCLRVLETGLRNLYCAEAELYHHESVSRGLDITVEKAARFNRELNYLQNKWKKYIDHDPAYNPNLTLKRENFAIKEPREYK